MARIQLVLDVAGVIVTNFSPGLWQDVASRTGVSDRSLRSALLEIKEALWTGRMTEADFWDWLLRQCPLLDRESARSLLHAQLQPLPAYRRIPEWSRGADVHLLSNHREEWITPLLAPIRPFLTGVTISSAVRCRKPDPAIYDVVAAHFDGDSRVIFVDDQSKNFPPAAGLGWRTVLADDAGAWMDEVDRMLRQGV